ncbi:PAS domain-containing protein, partial [bacterium]|nr:PAS domain-containing protein [bacterium]
MTEELDTTARMLQELAGLRDSNSLIRGVWDSYVGSVVVLDADGTVIYANQNAANLFGIRIDDLVGKRYNDSSWDLRTVDGDVVPSDRRPYRYILNT